MPSFADDLKRYGPTADFSSITLEESKAYCRKLALSHYENFIIGSCFLPKELVPHFHHIYAFCRWADDLGDETGGGETALELLSWWREELQKMYQGTSRHPVMQALATTVQEFHIPQQPFLDLISAFEQDQRVKEYDTYSQLLDYCTRSANPVGLLVLHLFRSVREETVARSNDICTGLQLANFWQDVARDYAIGRIYLPKEDRQQFGYDAQTLQSKTYNPAFKQLLTFEVNRARDLLERGSTLVHLLDACLQPEIHLFVSGGLETLKRIEAIDYNVWKQRPKLSKWTQARLLFSAWRTKRHRKR